MYITIMCNFEGSRHNTLALNLAKQTTSSDCSAGDWKNSTVDHRTQRSTTLLVQVEAFLLRGGKQSVAQYLLGRILGQFEIVDTRVDRRVAAVGRVDFADNG